MRERNKIISKIIKKYNFVDIKFTNGTSLIFVLVGYDTIQDVLFDEKDRIVSSDLHYNLALDVVRQEYTERALLGVLGIRDVESVNMYYAEREN